MTDQSPTAAFAALPFLDGSNADHVDLLIALHMSASVNAGCPGRALLQAIKG